MAPKKTNIKIKRSKVNLYNKKKSKARQALTVILTIAAACVLGVVGYGVGKPVLDYLRSGAQYTSDGSSGEQPSGSDMSGAVGESGSDAQSASESSAGSAPESSLPDSSDVSAPVFDGSMYFLPDNAAASSTSLNSALAAAKSAGATTVAVTLKDQKGNFLYKSGIAEIATSITGTLTAAQISDIITKAGFVPAAKISTLMDSLNPAIVDASYEHSPTSPYSGCWLDNRQDRGGKLWISPFKNNAATFLKKITSELTAAGFSHIICANTRFPAFFESDMTVYLSDLPLKDSAKRAAALWSVLDAIDAASGDKTQMWIELESAGIAAESRLGTDAEICSDKTKLAASKIIINYTAGGNAADAYKNAKDFAAKAKTVLGGAETAVLIKGFSGSALADVQRAFKEADLPVLVQ
ncbi:MAG: hypothetical protein NC401_16015 [Ruminococcus sp.]|nr:hypothetical protein [Ruminococcus sp.]